MKELGLGQYIMLEALRFTPFSVFSSKQKEWIRQRDGNKCNAPIRHKCNGNKQLHVHHILPQRYCEDLGIDPDFAENGITICENFHNTVIHPDIADAKSRYHQDKKAFDQVFDERNDMVQRRQIYWNDNYDRPLHATAVRNTQRFIKKTKTQFPPNPYKK